MPVHDLHIDIPGYHEGQVLVDGCGLCEARSRHIPRAIQMMSDRAFEVAWNRATLYMIGSLDTNKVSNAETPLLDVLASVQRQFAKRGIPVGDLPGELQSMLDDNQEEPQDD